ncbi:protein-tyrosine phosphatase family protein [Pyrococcus yayanosii]|uniref:Dual specificity phosphatase, catalytic domain, putative n=1 Tax=Pyrococcus yayanosii (strain CH1 / JCM 16557) TaxID=529709 RepID=F8AG67_PYRYC|nr:dual specificity protein phosphatase family protein [Pyrococcus yayanosii]AEH23903.1 Dual specificity phosphatase, catalytic domain, putative [Pyrococcus yayanosii CH1]
MKFVTERVAFSPMPTLEELGELLKEFRAFVVLVEDFELEYDIEALEEVVDVLYSLIPDFPAPSLEQLLEIVQWIEARVREGKKVLIHCLSGSGRSGTVAVAYLMYSQGLSLHDALSKVRSLKPSAIETEDQMDVLRAFEVLLAWDRKVFK